MRIYHTSSVKSIFINYFWSRGVRGAKDPSSTRNRAVAFNQQGRRITVTPDKSSNSARRTEYGGDKSGRNDVSHTANGQLDHPFPALDCFPIRLQIF